MSETRRVGWRRSIDDESSLLSREWLVTNALGGYASGTIIGAPTRRYHGVLVAALPNPHGRTMMLTQVSEQLRCPDGKVHRLGAYERMERLELHGASNLLEFHLEDGLPIWTYELGEWVVEKRIVFANLQNTVFVSYRLIAGEGAVRLSLRPEMHFRSHDAPVSEALGPPYSVTMVADRFEVTSGPLPPLRLLVRGDECVLVYGEAKRTHITYRVEAARGYSAAGDLWTPGHFKTWLVSSRPATLIASTEAWEDMTALTSEEALEFDLERRARLVAIANLAADDATARELVLASDHFVVSPRGRVRDATRAHARGDELRSVIAGYHWFTDWGRDTMISLEGLTLQTGRHQEARWILQMFARSVRDGLIPNLFPEGSHEGLYHTADASLWFFHAVDRYLDYTGDWDTGRDLLPILEEIARHHIHGTRFGIGVDPSDGLLRQGEQGYQLTWMDAKCDGWVVTPRRGKAVEINALWYNALTRLGRWIERYRGATEADEIRALAAQAKESFNARFWCDERQHLYDVIDGDDGKDDAALRPNQLFAISLPDPVLARERWGPVLDSVTRELLTPVGLRSLAPSHPDYKPSYHGDLRTRDAAYHQGTVWSWLIGPYVDALLRTRPDERTRARSHLQGLVAHLGEACVGSVSEVFDAEPPFTPRGCIAQAWGVAELLRAWRRTSDTTPVRQGE